MLPLCRPGFSAVVFAATVMLAPGVICAVDEEKDTRDGAGIVWFIGAVLQKSWGQATIDLGDAQALHEGDEVTVFRSRDDHFRPLGTIRIEQSLQTWAIPAKTIRFELEAGDRIVYVRTLAQLGTGHAFRDNFLRQQIVKTGHANNYSTMQQLEEAAVLQRFVSRQPRWQRDQEHIAGTIRSTSVSRKDVEEMKPLLAQVMKFQDYRTLGVPIEPVIGAEWQSVLATLTPARVEVFDSIQDAPSPAEASTTPANANAAEDSAKFAKKIASIRRHVEQLLFLRSPEERRVVTMICAALDKAQPRNERQWYSLQLLSTQFASLSEEKQLLDEFELVMRQVRAEE